MIQKVVKNSIARLSPETQIDLGIKLFSIFKLPLLAFCWPKVLRIDQARSEMRIPLSVRTQNHLGVMYFGALAIGAEVTISLHVLDEIRQHGQIEFIFKDFQVEFLKRAAGDVTFVCEQGEGIRALVQKARTSGARETASFEAYALTPKQTGEEKIATFKLTLSVKQK